MADQAAVTGRLRVLVVDDEPGMCRGVARALERFAVPEPDLGLTVSFSVAQAASGEEALAMMAQGLPDLLLLDHKLPGISGIEVLERLPAGEHDLRTIMITAYASLETAVTAIKRGAYDFLLKSFTPDELRAVVRKAAHAVVLARQARQLAAEKRQVRFQFISVLGHELKAPLGAIEGYLRIMRDRAAGSELAAYDEAVARSLVRADQMRKLIEDLLQLTRIESGQRARTLAPTDAMAVLRAAAETVQPDAQARGISVTLAGPVTLPVLADATELEIIANNLLTNAVKYNRDGGTVTATLASAVPGLTLTVADTGIGMTAEETARLFGEFVRMRNAKTKHILGSGLGLSIVKKLAELNGGSVTVASTPDAGTTVTVALALPAAG